MEIRKLTTITEQVRSEGGRAAERPITRVAGIGVLANPFVGQSADDLSQLFQMGHDLGDELMASMLPQLPHPAVSYGKGAIVGVNGDLEHGHAMLHPMLGKAMRDPLGGGASLIPSAARVGAAGASLDVPLGHKDDQWSFDHFDAITIAIPDSPRPDEIMMVIVIADGGRPAPRTGSGRVVT